MAQLRVIFSPDLVDNGVPLRKLFVYVQPLKIAYNAKGNPDPNISMYRYARCTRSNGTRKGLVFPLEEIWRPVEMVPKFGKACNTGWTCDTAVEEAQELYLNCFADMASYIEVY